MPSPSDIALRAGRAATAVDTFTCNMGIKDSRTVALGHNLPRGTRNRCEPVLPNVAFFASAFCRDRKPSRGCISATSTKSSSVWKAGVDRVLGGILEGWLKVPIEGIFSHAKASDMYRRIESRQVAGKLLLHTGA
jgi:hypothetical protein